MVGVFAGFRSIRERRVLRRVGQVERRALLHDLADQALAGLHPRDVDGLVVEAFRGEEFHLAIGTAQVDRADLRHHRQRDGAHDHIQTLLRRPPAGQRLADLLQQAPLPPRGDL